MRGKPGFPEKRADVENKIPHVITRSKEFELKQDLTPRPTLNKQSMVFSAIGQRPCSTFQSIPYNILTLRIGLPTPRRGLVLWTEEQEYLPPPALIMYQVFTHENVLRTVFHGVNGVSMGAHLNSRENWPQTTAGFWPVYHAAARTRDSEPEKDHTTPRHSLGQSVLTKPIQNIRIKMNSLKPKA